jgi:hypothetical protein
MLSIIPTNGKVWAKLDLSLSYKYHISPKQIAFFFRHKAKKNMVFHNSSLWNNVSASLPNQEKQQLKLAIWDGVQ